MAILVNLDDETEISIRCSCQTPEHNLFLHYYPESWPEIYVTAQPEADYSFWWRFKISIKYLFSKKRFSHIEMILNNEDVDKIIKFCNDYKENTKNFKPEDLKYHEHILKNPFLKVLNAIVTALENLFTDISNWIDKHRVMVDKEVEGKK